MATRKCTPPSPGPCVPCTGVDSGGDFGDVYEQAVVKTVAGFLRGNPTHRFGITRFALVKDGITLLVKGLHE